MSVFFIARVKIYVVVILVRSRLVFSNAYFDTLIIFLVCDFSQPAPGSLEAAAYSMAQEISKHPEDWEKRRDALVSMQQAVGRVVASGQGASSVFTVDMWRSLKEPLKHTLVRVW